MTDSELLLGSWTQLVREALYKAVPEATYWRESKLLKAALTWPAAEVKRLGWSDPGAGWYEELIRQALKKMVLEARTPPEKLGNRAAFFYKVLQDEFTHHQGDWWERAKAIAAGNAVKWVLADAKRALDAAKAAPTVTEVMAAAHELVKPRGGRPKGKQPAKEVAPPAQAELF